MSVMVYVIKKLWKIKYFPSSYCQWTLNLQ
jgi:hypothetical protein